MPVKRFDVFLSYAHDDAAWVEELARRLTDTHGYTVWLDKWVLVPGKSWQQAMARGLDEAKTCAVCVGGRTPSGWFQEEIERALDMQTRDSDFRVIPVLLPDSKDDLISSFLSLRTWADFRNGSDVEYAFHVLSQGIKGEPIGRWPSEDVQPETLSLTWSKQKLIELRKLRGHLHDQVVIEYERKILDKWVEN